MTPVTKAQLAELRRKAAAYDAAVVTNVWMTDTKGATTFSSGVLSPADVEKIGLPPVGLSRIPVRVIRE